VVRTGLSYAGVGAGRDVSAAATQPTGVRFGLGPDAVDGVGRRAE